MRVNTSRGQVSTLSLDARLTGQAVTDYSGSGPRKCVTPVELHLFGYPDKLLVSFGLETDKAVAQRLMVRCRKCDPCLEHRRNLWTARAIDETRAANRTWFGTLTLAPDRATWARYAAQKRIRQRISEESDENLHKETVNQVAPELTRFLKRCRKNSDARLRYFLVSERHKSGVPHWHILLHEYAGRITKAQLEAAWRYGFSQWRLVDGNHPFVPRYVAKYLAKAALTRVRASRTYGSALGASLTERIEDLAATLALHKARAIPPVERGVNL